MISRIVIEGYRCFRRLELEPNPGMNILVGANESGKSTLLEAISLGLTGRINGRWIGEELNPFWFNSAQVAAFFAALGTHRKLKPPTILIELYLSSTSNELQPLRGAINSKLIDCPGVAVAIEPSPEYAPEFAAYLADDPPHVLPVEFYAVSWRAFSNDRLTQRPKALATSFIDSRTLRSTTGVDYHTKEMLSEHLNAKERATLSIAHRRSKAQITAGVLSEINKRIAVDRASLHDRPLGLQMDQTSRTSWETGVVPQVDEIPFALAGQGQQAMIKVALAMSRTIGASTFVLIEEPENHLSHTSLRRLIARIEGLADADQQIFVTTHSSFVTNRLGLDKLILLHRATPFKLTEVPADTVAYFRKLSNYDTLRLVLAEKLVLVEGPSDAIVFERAFLDGTERGTEDAGVDVVSMSGLSFRRALEVCAGLQRDAVALRDNDGKTEQEITDPLKTLLKEGKRTMLVSDRGLGRTLEPQLIRVNDETALRRVLQMPDTSVLADWMETNKTEGALRILDHGESIVMPKYISDAVELVK